MKSRNEAPKKGGKSLFSKIIAWVHLWPSIVSGVVVVFVCLTGTIIVYCDEIMDFSARDALYVKNVGQKHISTEDIMVRMKKECPGFSVSEFVFFKDPHRTIRLRAFSPKGPMLMMVYMDPYTGEILKKDKTIYFFYVTAHLHASFLAGTAGHWIVTISTIIFVLSTVTGLVLWWPKKWTKATRRASFLINWKAKFKRFNYDLHNVLGFYTLVLCLVLGVTGLIIFFPGFAEFTVKLAGGTTEHLDDVLPPKDSTRTPVDFVQKAYAVLGDTDKEAVSVWNYERQKSGAYYFTLGKAGLKSTENSEYRIYDMYSGAPVSVAPEFTRHEKAENYVWQLHMGQWWGQIGKFSTFITGLIATSLPITGFLIWWGRRKKPARKKRLLRSLEEV